MIDQNSLHELFEYKDGGLYWKRTNVSARIKGRKAGYINNYGYRIITIKGKRYFAHRLIYLYQYGHLPRYLDHIDNDKDNNRIDNLRECSASQNQHNQKKRINNTSGVKGVSWNKKRSEWQAQVSVDYKTHHIGYFSTLDEAELAINRGRESLHKEFSNHG